MSDVKEVEVAEADPVACTAAKDRRRPGRLSRVSPELVPLLRGDAVPTPQPELQFGDPDQLQGVRGIPLAIALSAALWAGIAYAGHVILS